MVPGYEVCGVGCGPSGLWPEWAVGVERLGAGNECQQEVGVSALNTRYIDVQCKVSLQ